MPAIDLTKLARLAKMDLSEGEIAAFTPQLGKILGLMAELDKLPLEQAAPFRPGAETLRARPDVAAPCLTPAGALRNAPGREGALFTVPRAAPKKGGAT